jgi:hypothetical protein
MALELRLVTGAPAEPPHAWLQCPCVRGRRSTRGFACDCACHGAGGMALATRRTDDSNVVRLTRKLGA